MPKAYSDDLRVRVVRPVEGGASRRSTAAKFVSVSFVIRLLQRWHATGSSRARGTGGRKRHALEAHAAEQERADVAAARAAWRGAQPGLNPKRLVFIDETGAATNMARRHGRCPSHASGW